jgi:TPR repeat protein
MAGAGEAAQRLCSGCLWLPLVAAMAGTTPPAQALARPPTASAAAPLFVAVADAGVDIVRIPPKAPASGPPPSNDTNPPPLAAPRPDQPVQQLGSFRKFEVKVGGLPGDGQKGWLGVALDSIDLPLALSLGLVNANGAFVAETTPGGPAAQGGLRLGDIIVSANGAPVANVRELRQRVASALPGSELLLEVWRTDVGGGDFMQALRHLADDGNAYIMYRLGAMHASGIGVARDQIEAVRWYRKGAAAGNAQAMTALAQDLLEGRGTPKDPQEGLRWLKTAIDKGNLDAMHTMALTLLDGKLVPKDPQEAARLLTVAAEAGHAPAMVTLGLMYDSANGVQADPARAVHWYRRAAELGNSGGMVDLGYQYARGRGVEQNDTLAVSWYRRAVAAGNFAGMHNLAVMADGGRGMPRDPELAASLMLQALEAHYDFSYRQMTQSWRNWSRDTRRALQRRLRDAGFYSGNLDGEFAETTISAIDAYINRRR